MSMWASRSPSSARGPGRYDAAFPQHTNGGIVKTCGLPCHDEVCRLVAGRGPKLSERSGTLAYDPFSGREPTSHERLTGLPWDASYHDGPAPWDTGQP